MTYQKMKIESFRQVRTERMDIVTPCAPVGAKNQFYKLIVYWNLF